MKKNTTKIILFILCFLLCGLTACSSKSDPELNKDFSPIKSEGAIYSHRGSKYCDYYEDKFQNLSIDVVALTMGLDWFVRYYDDVYTGKEEYFYISAFNTPNISTEDLVDLYNRNPDGLYYLKPYLDCYQLMNKNKKPSEEELETIKETILYALEYYINGKDFTGTLD